MLLNTGTFSYNGISFTAGYSSKISAKVVPTGDNRATAFVEYTLTVDGYITATPGGGSSTDATLTAMRQALTQPAGLLVYTSKGFGDLSVNGNSPRQDVQFGPWPSLLEWVPIGNDQAAKVTWECVVRVAECQGGDNTLSTFSRSRFVEYVYGVDYDIDADGFTTATTSGYIVIPMTRPTQGARVPPNSVDLYRTSLQSAVPVGFQRDHQTFKLSKDRRRLDFTLVDKEIPTALPAGCTKIDARHTVTSGAGVQSGANVLWDVTIEATITLARGRPKTDAFAAFLLILRSRTAGVQSPLIPMKIEVDEDIFGRTSHFSITLR